MPAVAGVRNVTVGSQTVYVGDSVKVPLSDTKREVIEGLTGPAGYSEMPAKAYVEFDLVLASAVDLVALFEAGQTVQVDFKSGRSYVFDDGVVVGDPPDFDAATGKATIRIEGATGSGRWI